MLYPSARVFSCNHVSEVFLCVCTKKRENRVSLLYDRCLWDFAASDKCVHVFLSVCVGVGVGVCAIPVLP